MGARFTIWLGVGVGTLLALVGLARPGAGPVARPMPDAGEPSAAEAAADGRAEAASLAEALAAERAARQELAREVEALRAEIRRLAGAERPEPPEEHRATQPPAALPPLAAPVFDEQALLGAGFDAREAARLREQTEQLELEQLYLRDRAIREGWAGTPRFAEEARALDARARALREELGDDRYDWLLYAAGRPNRVVVQSVMERSPASDAGLRAGDAILSYGGTRLFEVSALREATTVGRAGESVAVDVVRSGERLRLYLPRGPLGVRLEELRQPPES